jgi:hypothetical protein
MRGRVLVVALPVLALAAVAAAVAVRSPAAQKAAAVRRCAPGAVAFSVAPPQGAAGSLFVSVRLVNSGRRSCAVRGIAALSLRGRRFGRLAVAPNPARLRLHARLAAGARVALAGRWTNWCGRANPRVRWRLTLGRRSVELRRAGSPPCNGPGQPSTLSLQRVRP